MRKNPEDIAQTQNKKTDKIKSINLIKRKALTEPYALSRLCNFNPYTNLPYSLRYL